MSEIALLTVGAFVFLIIVIIIVIALVKKSASTNKTDTYNIPAENYQPVNIDEPVLTNHAAMRMQERLGIYGSNQIELMNKAFKYGRTADRASGDLRIKLETAEMKYDEETKAKFYNNSIFIFTAEDNVLKTVYPFDYNSNKHYWH